MPAVVAVKTVVQIALRISADQLPVPAPGLGLEAIDQALLAADLVRALPDPFEEFLLADGLVAAGQQDAKIMSPA